MYKNFTKKLGKRPGYAFKFLLIMKLIVVIFMMTILQVNASVSYAQNISIKEKNAPLEKILKQIRTQSGYDFFYNQDLVRSIKSIDVNLRNATIDEALQQCFAGQPLTYSISEKIVVIRKKEQRVLNIIADSIITGTVSDASTKAALVGVTIKVKNSIARTITDSKGNFRLLTSIGAVLQVSYLGYETQEIKVTKRTIDIRLKEATQALNDVVVTGIFSQSKSTFTGAERTFSAKELGKVSNNSVLSALKSLDPSFQIPENLSFGSNPNVLPDVVLRGGNTLVDIRQNGQSDPFNYQATPNAPLFILDGFETTLQRVNDLDMNRVASVTILKDAGATAIYGSRGANGVVVIEQLRPVDGKLRFSYNANVTVEAPDLSGYDLLNAREKFDLEDRSDIFKNSFNTTQNALDLVRSSRLNAVNQGINTDWIAKPLRSAIGQKHNIYVEGGADAVTYGVSLTYDQKSGVMKGSDRKTTTANSFLSYRLKNFQFKNDLTLSFNKANNSPYGSFKQYTRLNPYWSPYDENGNLKVYLEEVIDPQTGLRITSMDSYDNLNGYTGRPVNPLYNASLNITDQNSFKGITNNFETRWQAQDWLRITGRLSYTQQSDQSDIFLPAQHSSFANIATFEKGSYTKGTGNMQRIEGFLTGEANKAFKKHFLSASATLNVMESSYDTQSIRVQGFPNPNLDQLILGNQYPAGAKPTGSESLSRSLGTLGRLAYAYDSRYLFDATYRLDGSSLFGSDRRFAPFWSLGAGWNVQNEAFLKGSKTINELRLRYTVGTTGSESFESYKGISTSQYYTDREYRGVIASYLLGYGNSALAWQKTLKHNVGIDLTLFNKFTLNANYFVERTKGSIAFISSAPSTGFNGYYDNMGDVLNKGYELYGRYNIIADPRSRNNLSVFANVFHVTNKIEKISSTIKALNDKANTTRSTTPLPRYAEGQSVNVIWAVKSLGIDPASGLELFQKRNGDVTTVYDPADQVIVGDATPIASGTFGANMELNGIGFNVYLRFNVGGDAYNQTLVDRVENVNVGMYNVDRRVAEERWRNPGDITFYRGILDYRNNATPSITYATSRFVQKNNFITGESASVYYRFSDKLNKKIGVQNTKITLFSSEFFRLASIKRERGLDYPFSRSFTLQLQTAF